MKKTFLGLALLFHFISYSQSNDPQDYKWDLSSLYENESLWKEDIKLIETELSYDLKKDKSQWVNPNEFLHALNYYTTLKSRSAKAALYGVLNYEEFASRKNMMDKGMELYHQVMAYLTPIDYAIVKIDQQLLQKWINQNAGIAEYSPTITHIRNSAQYSLNPKAEAVMTRSVRWTENNTELFWELHKLHGKTNYWVDDTDSSKLDRSFFRSNRASSDRSKRDLIAGKYFESLNDFSNLFAQLYKNKIESELIRGQLRGYEDGISASWNRMDGMPQGLHKKLVEFAKKHKSTLHRYALLKKKVLGVDTLQYLDFYTQVGPLSEREYPFSESIELGLKSAKIFGKDFQSSMREALDEAKQFHFANTEEKTVRYHIHPPVGGSLSYYGFQYRPDHVRARALVGGLYGTIFNGQMNEGPALNMLEGPVHIYGNGTIYIGDIMYDDELTERLKGQMKTAYMFNQLEFFKRLFKWAIFIELEEFIQDGLIANIPPDGEEISAKYLALLRSYYGHEEGVTFIADHFKNEWMSETAVPFMGGYQHHAWPVAMSFATLMVEKVKNNTLEKPFRLDFSNGYDSYHILLQNGIDLSDNEHYEAVIKRMEKLMEEIERKL